MRVREVVIRRFALGPLAQWGFVTGVIIACLPSFLCSWLVFTLAGTLRVLIGSWRDVGFTVLGQRISFNLVDTLNLQNVLQTLNTVSALGIFGIVILFLVLSALLGIFGALVLTALGLFYNTTGRVRLELEEAETNARRA